VLGLSTALSIQQHLKPSQSLLIVARDFPNTTSINYASPWAGAHYRPTPGKSPQLIAEARWARRAYEVFQKIAAEEPAAGVKFMEGIEYFENPSPEYLDALGDPDSAYDHLASSLRELSPAELPEGVKWGIRYWSYSVNSPVYCAHLLRKFILRGGQIKEYTLASLPEAFHMANNVQTVVNCSGLGFADPKSFIIRGMRLKLSFFLLEDGLCLMSNLRV
jgi:D-amino-acid oxidase